MLKKPEDISCFIISHSGGVIIIIVIIIVILIVSIVKNNTKYAKIRVGKCFPFSPYLLFSHVVTVFVLHVVFVADVGVYE